MAVQLKEPVTKLVAVQTGSSSTEPAISLGLADLWSLRHLIAIMVRRDFLGRYRGSLMGALWPLINPLGHLLLYTFVFSIVLKVRFGADASTGNFALYLMTGLLPWGSLAEALARSTTCILEVPNLVKRVVFPLEILPFVVLGSSLLSEMVGMALLIPAICIYLKAIHWTILFLPLVALSKILLIGGLTWLLSSLGVFIRDVRHMISLALSVWMYVTPIVYPQSAIPENLQFLCWINPMAGIVTDYRRVLLQGLQPDWTMYAFYTCLSLAIWLIGYNFFLKTKRSFADVM